MIRIPLDLRMAGAGFLLLALSSSPACAQGGAAPSLLDVEEMVVQPVHFGNESVSKSCGILAQELDDELLNTLVDSGVPAFFPNSDRPLISSRARIDLVPNIFSYNSEGLDCVSWVSLSAESRNSVHVPPVDPARNVSIIYWREGSLLAGELATHESLLKDNMHKMALELAAEYKQDQPAQSPSPQPR